MFIYVVNILLLCFFYFLPVCPWDAVSKNIQSIFPVKTVDVEIIINTQFGLNLFGTQLLFVANNFEIPVGGGKNITIRTPSITIDITPVFKFVVFTARAFIPFNLFNTEFKANISMTIDNIEAEIGAVIDGDHDSLPSPPILKGVHFDEFGVGMGIIFEPPGYALGVQGKFHISNSDSVAPLTDDTFVIICELEGDVPNPVYLSFYVPKLNVRTLINLFTNSDVDLGLPVDFEDMSFTWCENLMEPVVLPDGTLSNGEFAFRAYMNMLGLKFYSNLQISLNGIEGKAQCLPVDLGGILRIDGNSKAIVVNVDSDGNIIKNNQIPKTQKDKKEIADAKTKTIVPAGGPELTISTSRQPYFSLSAAISLLDVAKEDIEATVDNSGISFELDYGSIIKTKMTCVVKDYHNFSCAFKYGPDFNVHLTTPSGFSLGVIRIDMIISAFISLSIDNSNVDFSVSGNFNIEDSLLNFGPFDLDVKISKLTDVLKLIESSIISYATNIFNSITKDAKKWVEFVKNGTVNDVKDIVSVLKEGFKLTYQETADILHEIGYEANFIAQELREIYDVESYVAAMVLKNFGYAENDITEALKYAAYGFNDVIIGLKSIGYTANEVTGAISCVFANVVPSVLNTAMQEAGYAVDDIKNAFESAGGSLANFTKNAWSTLSHDLNPSNW